MSEGGHPITAQRGAQSGLIPGLRGVARPLRFPSAMKNVKEGLQQMAHLALRVYLKVHCGHRVRGKARLARPSVLVANHASHMDIAAIFAALPISEVTRVRTAAARDTIYAMPCPVVAARPMDDWQKRPKRPFPCSRKSFPNPAFMEQCGAMAKPPPALNEIARSKHEKVKVAITDIDGVLRGKYLQKDKFLAAAKSGF